MSSARNHAIVDSLVNKNSWIQIDLLERKGHFAILELHLTKETIA